MGKRAVLAIFCLVFVTGASVFADEKDDDSDEPTQSSISTLYKADTSDSTDFNLDANVELKKGSHLSAGYEVTQSPANSFSPTDLDTNELRLGFSGDFRDDYSYTLNYSLWGSSGQITSNTFSVEIRWLGDDWISTIEPGYRLISVPILDDSQLKKEEGIAAPSNVEVSDPSAMVSANYVGLDPWHFKLTLGYYDYSRQLGSVFSTQLAKFFSSSALNASSDFNEAEFIGECGYGFKLLSLAFEYEYAISAYDYSTQITMTGKVTFFFLKSLDIEVDGGQSPGVGVGSPSVSFLSLGLTGYF